MDSTKEQDSTPELEALAAQVIEIMGWPARAHAPKWLAEVLRQAGTEAVSQAVAAERARCAGIANRYGAAGESGAIAAEILGVPYVCPPLRK